MTQNPFSGCIPALMTPCTPDRAPDTAALVRKAKELTAAGMSAVVYCGSMGDWPLLTDEQRMAGVAALVAAGVPTIVGTGAVNTKTAVAHASHAAEVGAQGLMVIPRVLSRGTSSAAQEAHFKAVLTAAPDLPTASQPGRNCSLRCATRTPTSWASRSSAELMTCAMRLST